MQNLRLNLSHLSSLKLLLLMAFIKSMAIQVAINFSDSTKLLTVKLNFQKLV